MERLFFVCKTKALFQMQTMFFSKEALLISLSSDDLLHKNYDSSTVVSSQVRKLRFSSLLCSRFKIQKNFSFEGITNIFTSQGGGSSERTNSPSNSLFTFITWLKCPQEITTTYARLKNEVWFDGSLNTSTVSVTNSTDIFRTLCNFCY